MRPTAQAGPLGALSAGQREVCAHAYRLYKRDVVALVATMLGREDAAWDVLHDVFASLVRQAPNLDLDSDLKGYLLAAGANRARNVLAKWRLIQATKDFAEAAAEMPCPCTDDPLEVVVKEAEAEHVRRAVLALPDEQRMVVALHVYGGLTFREVAEQEGISENTAQSRYRYALDKLRREYRKMDS